MLQALRHGGGFSSLPHATSIVTCNAAAVRVRQGPSSRLARTAVPSTIDVVALGNLCVDVVIPVAELPPADLDYRKELLSRLAVDQTTTDNWEIGGNCNFIMAAARMGLGVSSVGHLGDDQFGHFMEIVLQEEEAMLGLERILSHGEASSSSSNHNTPKGVATSQQQPHSSNISLDDVNQTLVCFVLVDPNSNHAFCSRYDFGPWPLLGNMSALPQQALDILNKTHAVFLNGFIFDELPLEVVRHACKHAMRQGAAVFFDPGPRCHTMMEGQRRAALDEVMDLSEVVLMTEEEALTVTGHVKPELAARQVLSRPNSQTQWVVIKLGANGALLVDKATGKMHTAPGFKVQVVDTVGCGDSFAAAIVLGYIRRQAAQVVLTLANAVGAATATGRGAGRNVATASKVKSLLKEALAAADTTRKHNITAALEMLNTSAAATHVSS